jgi:hypothetical protein
MFVSENELNHSDDEHIFTKHNIVHNSVDECECCICLENMSNSTDDPKPLVVLACGHELHEHCLYSSVRHNIINNVRTNKCPLCKKLISLNTQTYYEVQLINKKGVSFFVFGIFLFVQLIQLSTIFIRTQSKPD